VRRPLDTARPPLAVRDDLIVREIDSEVLVYDRKRHRAHCLGPLAAAIWKACDGTRAVAAVAEAASRAGALVDGPAAELVLRRLRRARLVSGFRPSPPDPHRRALLRQAAAAAGLAVFSMASPTALQAASCTPGGQCVAMPNSQCSGLPCCESPARRCTKQGNASRCDCN
jgi:hypothetical protein